jgi:hypothetical protein
MMFIGFSSVSANELKKNGFSISLPDGWIEIPKNVIDEYEKKAVMLAPEFSGRHNDYGFQLKSSKTWFEYPYILLQIKNRGRIPESQLEKLELSQEDFDKLKKGASSIMPEIQAGKMIYDKQTKVIWMYIESNVKNIGQISGLLSIVPTENGFIQAMGYCFRENYSTYGPIFQSVVLSISPEPGLVYKPKWSDSLPSAITGIDWPKAIAYAIVFGILASIEVMRRKKKKDKK